MKKLVEMKKTIAATKKKQGGFSLIEMAVVLVIIAGILVGVTQQGKDQKESIAVDNEAKAVLSLINNLSGYYDGSTTGYTGLDNATAISAGLVPTGLKNNGVDTITNKWLGAVTVAPGTISTAGDSSSVTLAGIPGGDVCSTMVKKTAELVDQISVAGTVVKAFGGDLNRGTLATQCDADTVTLVLLTR